MINNEFLVGVYKEVGKPPDIVKIKNDKAYLEKLLDGEYINQDYDDYTILYKKDSEHLLPNIYVNQYSKIGISLKGKVFAVSKDENGNLKSLNKEQAKRCITFFLRESFNYKNFDEYGRYIPRSKRKGNKKNLSDKVPCYSGCRFFDRFCSRYSFRKIYACGCTQVHSAGK